ncbi:hypothetical protein JOQ06_000535, partial [Pogonophryne albipinna]
PGLSALLSHPTPPRLGALSSSRPVPAGVPEGPRRNPTSSLSRGELAEVNVTDEDDVFSTRRSWRPRKMPD